MFSALDGYALQDRCFISKGLAWHELNIGDGLLVKRKDASFLEGQNNVLRAHCLQVGLTCNAGHVIPRDSFAYIFFNEACTLAVIIPLKWHKDSDIKRFAANGMSARVGKTGAGF
ncbi:hypothetical protein DPMN_081350 [Dreissena polymorpha]|uniref:Uncharacterized protein n=1 Tax=Dreissena polymorpha TaxID=45954 RepID=A0A9D3Y7W3_DREPO|nr:hypothetical protein DPMN_081350 [Dreissena polymorpha]